MKKFKAFLIAIVLSSFLFLASCGNGNSIGWFMPQSEVKLFKYIYSLTDEKDGYILSISQPTLSGDMAPNEDPEYLFDSVPMGQEELILPSYHNGLPIVELGDCSVLRYDTELKTIILPEKLEGIVGYNRIMRPTFWECKNIENVVFPSTLKEIGAYSFQDCTSLKRAVLPASITSIDSGVFYGCSALKEVVLPNTITSIRDYAFFECMSLKKVNLEEGLITIGAKAFSGSALETIEIPDTLEDLGKDAFAHTKAIKEYEGLNYVGSKRNPYKYCVGRAGNEKDVQIKEGCEIIQIDAFSETDIESVSCPSSLKKILNHAFSGSKLNSITFEEGLEYIGDNSFKGTCLTNVSLPNSLKVMGRSSFEDCSLLESVTLSDSLVAISNNAFLGCKLLTSINIPNSVKRLGQGCFYDCTGLENVQFSKNLKFIGQEAFENCSSLKEVILPEGLEILNDDIFLNCTSLETITIPDSVLKIPFRFCQNCTILKNVKLSNNLQYISSSAFRDCKSLNEITLPDKLETIGDAVFYGCPLNNVVIPKTVHSIGKRVFEKAVLDTITFEEGAYGIQNDSFRTSGLEYLGDDVNPHYILLENNLDVEIDKDCKVIAEGAIYKTTFGHSCVIPEGVIRIDDLAITAYITQLSLPNSLESIGEFMTPSIASGLTYNEFENGLYLGNETNPYLVFVKMKNPYITSITVASSCKFIFAAAFHGNQSIREVTLPEGLKEIGDSAFSGSALEHINIPSTVKRIGKSAFFKCEKLKEINLPNSITRIEESTFGNCVELTKFTVPDSVTRIDNNAFEGCKFERTSLPETVTYIAWFDSRVFILNKNLNNCYARFMRMEDNRIVYFDGTIEEYKNMYIYVDPLEFNEDFIITIRCTDGDLKAEFVSF